MLKYGSLAVVLASFFIIISRNDTSIFIRPSTAIGAVLGVLFLSLRKQRKIQQANLAENVGLTQPTWSKIERGHGALTLSLFEKKT